MYAEIHRHFVLFKNSLDSGHSRFRQIVVVERSQFEVRVFESDIIELDPKFTAIRSMCRNTSLSTLTCSGSDARHIAVGPQGVVTFVGTRKTKVWVVTDRSRGGVGDEVKEFAPTLPKKIPNGACFSKDGFLYIVEQNRVVEYPAAEFFYESADVVPARRGRRRADSEG